ncbi:pyocin knob domain-containing protein [Microcoleus sp. ARI1-B5]|uniref:pyocin knob domain-containing protein n=1 Tax=unclassified Microcoleus TaxID=2642155 RepID=UPI002FD1F726
MESITETLAFSRRLVPADGTNTVTLLDLAQWTQKFAPFLADYEIFYECRLVDVKVRPTIPSLQLPVATDNSVPRSDRGERLQLAAKQLLSQKIALQFFGIDTFGAWAIEKELTLEGFPFEGEIALDDRAISSSFKLGVGVPNKWQAPLKTGDSILVAGAVSAKAYFKKKDDPALEVLSNRLTALENLLQLFGAATPTAAGTNGLVNAASAGQQNYLLRGDRTWQNPQQLGFVSATANETIFGNKTFTGNIEISTAWLLESRSNNVAFNANNLTFNQYAATIWIDGGVTNSNFPVNSGMLLQFDALFGTTSAAKYRQQDFTDGSGNWWKRSEYNGVWGTWKKLVFS